MSTKNTLEAVDRAPDEIISMLRSQEALYARLETLTSKQKTLVAKEDTAPLLSLLADRQRVSIELQRLAHRLEPIRRNWAQHRGRLTLKQCEEADALLALTRSRLERVMQSDERDARVLSNRKVAVAGALREAHAGGVAVSAYRADAPRRMSERVDEAS